MECDNGMAGIAMLRKGMVFKNPKFTIEVLEAKNEPGNVRIAKLQYNKSLDCTRMIYVDKRKGSECVSWAGHTFYASDATEMS